MFTTLLRFDLVYYVHFKCNLKHVYEYANLFGYLKELYQIPAVRQTCNFEHIKGHYFGSHRSLNPRGIIPKGPLLALGAPHDRG
jgi:putative glutathione S-transferase